MYGCLMFTLKWLNIVPKADGLQVGFRVPHLSAVVHQTLQTSEAPYIANMQNNKQHLKLKQNYIKGDISFFFFMFHTQSSVCYVLSKTTKIKKKKNILIFCKFSIYQDFQWRGGGIINSYTAIRDQKCRQVLLKTKDR